MRIFAASTLSTTVGAAEVPLAFLAHPRGQVAGARRRGASPCPWRSGGNASSSPYGFSSSAWLATTRVSVQRRVNRPVIIIDLRRAKRGTGRKTTATTMGELVASQDGETGLHATTVCRPSVLADPELSLRTHVPMTQDARRLGRLRRRGCLGDGQKSSLMCQPQSPIFHL